MELNGTDLKALSDVSHLYGSWVLAGESMPIPRRSHRTASLLKLNEACADGKGTPLSPSATYVSAMKTQVTNYAAITCDIVALDRLRSSAASGIKSCVGSRGCTY